MDANGKILVTGASGFIGGRIVEMLVSRGARVRVATSNPDHCGQLAGAPVEIVKADLRDHAALARAVEGCSTVFHVAYKFGGGGVDQRAINFDGTRALAEAAIQTGVRRFVHFSSIAAYGPPTTGDLNEAVSARPPTDIYSETKQKIDAMLRQMHKSRRLPAVILQPTIVYGPKGSMWTTQLIKQVKSRRVALPASGQGLCNAVYVDDVACAALLASERDAAIGESFLISAAAPVTWREFYEAYAQMSDGNPATALDDAQFDAEARRRYGRFRLLAKVRRRLEPRLVSASELASRLYLPDPGTRALYAARTIVHIDKAREKLGYAPSFDLARGMAETAVWAQNARLI